MTLGNAFRRVASAFPGRLALVQGTTALTYRELYAAARDCAGRVDSAANGRDYPVAISVGRTVASAVGVLAATLSGRPYVPIDTAWPKLRRQFVMTDSGASALVEASGEDIDVVPLPHRSRKCGKDIAYVIYTSGSTGPPKGCLVTHANVLSLFDATAPLFEPKPTDTCSVFHSLAFDFSVWELWSAWLYGGVAWIPEPGTLSDPHRLISGIALHKVTRLSVTPSLFTHIAGRAARSGPSLPWLRSVVLGGEPVRLADAHDFLRSGAAPNARLANMYGITETTVHVTHLPVDLDTVAMRPGTTPIGTPIASLDMSLRNTDGHLVPPGTVGEIWVSGAGVCSGYLNRGNLNGERFVCDENNRRWYRTGDLGCFDNVAYHHAGRDDRQVQLRGYRIELGEVEHALEGVPGVAQAVVTVEERAITFAPMLVAYIRLHTDSAGTTGQTLRNLVRAVLPAYAVPQTIRCVEEVPMTTNGKTDLEALRTLARDRAMRKAQK